MKMDDKDILKNWNELLRISKQTFTGERQKNILKLYEHFENRMPYTPASSFSHFHNAFPGGYVEHVLRVIDMSKKTYELWKDNGALINFTEEELVFAAMFHDLGKVGNLEEDFYIPEESDWHKAHLNRMYNYNPKPETAVNTSYVTFYLLNQFGVEYSFNEMMGIIYADGMYSEGNVPYMKVVAAEKKMKTNIGFIIHSADFLALNIERGKWITEKNETSGNDTTSNEKQKTSKYATKKGFAEVAKTVSGKNMESVDKIFDEFFNNGDRKK